MIAIPIPPVDSAVLSVFFVSVGFVMIFTPDRTSSANNKTIIAVQRYVLVSLI